VWLYTSEEDFFGEIDGLAVGLTSLAVTDKLLKTVVFDFKGDETIDPAFFPHLAHHCPLTDVGLVTSWFQDDCSGGCRLELYRFGKGFEQ
jgi:hypothetical protein